MKRKCMVIFAFCVLGLFSAAEAASIKWVYSYNDALSQAKKKNMPVMVDFYGKNCGWCVKLDNETYRDARVIEISRKFICLKIDVSKNRSVSNKYQVRGLPTVIFINSDGKKLGGGAGYRNADRFVPEMNAVLSKYPRQGGSSDVPGGAGKIIRSTKGTIGAFAKNWWWSKQRNQDGEYAETSIKIKLPEKIAKATLVIIHGYSQKQGKGNATVHIWKTSQIFPLDKLHYNKKQNWWVGKAGTLGRCVGSFETRYSGNSPTRLNVTGFVQENPAGCYYVAVRNLSAADIGIKEIYLEVEAASYN